MMQSKMIVNTQSKSYIITMIDFIGREKEKNAIKKTIDNKERSILIYGPRRVGKTTLT